VGDGVGAERRRMVEVFLKRKCLVEMAFLNQIFEFGEKF